MVMNHCFLVSGLVRGMSELSHLQQLMLQAGFPFVSRSVLIGCQTVLILLWVSNGFTFTCKSLSFVLRCGHLELLWPLLERSGCSTGPYKLLPTAESTLGKLEGPILHPWELQSLLSQSFLVVLLAASLVCARHSSRSYRSLDLCVTISSVLAVHANCLGVLGLQLCFSNKEFMGALDSFCQLDTSYRSLKEGNLNWEDVSISSDL